MTFKRHCDGCGRTVVADSQDGTWATIHLRMNYDGNAADYDVCRPECGVAFFKTGTAQPPENFRYPERGA